MNPTLVIGTILFTLVSCKPTEKEVPPETQKAPAPKHPWDWTPSDPALTAGKETYLLECAGCHNEGEEGAPSLTKAKEWEKREAKGLATLLDHAINGYDGIDGEMPARGGTPSLTDEQVTNAVKFMLNTPK